MENNSEDQRAAIYADFGCVVWQIDSGWRLINLAPDADYSCSMPLELLKEFSRLEEGAGEKCFSGLAWFYAPPYNEDFCIYSACVLNEQLHLCVEVGREALQRKASLPLKQVTDLLATAQELGDLQPHVDKRFFQLTEDVNDDIDFEDVNLGDCTIDIDEFLRVIEKM